MAIFVNLKPRPENGTQQTYSWVTAKKRARAQQQTLRVYTGFQLPGGGSGGVGGSQVVSRSHT